MVVAYAMVALFAAVGTILVLWPLGIIVAFAAAPFMGSLAAFVVALCVRPSKSPATARDARS